MCSRVDRGRNPKHAMYDATRSSMASCARLPQHRVLRSLLVSLLMLGGDCYKLRHRDAPPVVWDAHIRSNAASSLRRGPTAWMGRSRRSCSVRYGSVAMSICGTARGSRVR